MFGVLIEPLKFTQNCFVVTNYCLIEELGQDLAVAAARDRFVTSLVDGKYLSAAKALEGFSYVLTLSVEAPSPSVTFLVRVML